MGEENLKKFILNKVFKRKELRKLEIEDAADVFRAGKKKRA